MTCLPLDRLSTWVQSGCPLSYLATSATDKSEIDVQEKKAFGYHLSQRFSCVAQEEQGTWDTCRIDSGTLSEPKHSGEN